MAVKIVGAEMGSPAESLNLPEGTMLVSINGEEISDILDYGFYSSATELDLVFELPDGTKQEAHISKDEYTQLGLESDSFLMDKEHSCWNNCIFCFIDQNPKGMRRSIYFKDDDERMSFLFGSYVTLTNLSDHDVERIIRMKISPVNISVHTTNPELRNRMLGNRFAGRSLKYLYQLAEAGVDINCQIVLCRDWNDGEELKSTLEDLVKLCPQVGSIAVVPVGLTSHREGLTPLRGFDKESSKETLEIIRPIAARCREKYGNDVVFASDEFYLMAEEPMLPPEDYGDYLQIENGVGMCTQLEDEFKAALRLEDPDDMPYDVDIATGFAAKDLMIHLGELLKPKFPNVRVHVHAIRNDFYGPTITVAGLLTAQDILAQLKDVDLKGEYLCMTEAVLRRDNDRFLDDVTRAEFEEKLGKPLRLTSDGFDLLDAMLGRQEGE